MYEGALELMAHKVRAVHVVASKAFGSSIWASSCLQLPTGLEEEKRGISHVMANRLRDYTGGSSLFPCSLQ